MNKHPGIARTVLLVLSISFLVISCRQVDVYEKNKVIPHYKWQHNYMISGSFIIKDTQSLYNLYIVLRHTDAYQYNNIWLKAGLKAPGDSMVMQHINLTLGTDAGGWDGTGMNDIWEVRKLLNVRPQKFKKGGEYEFGISQIMRDNPLPEIMSVGFRVQKVH